MKCTAVKRKVDSVIIIDLSGKFIFGDGTGMIRNCVGSLLDQGERNILLNLAAVTYIDSAAGIGELVSSYTTARRQGAAVKLLNPGRNVLHVIEISGLRKVFEIFDDESAAVASFQQIAVGS